MSRTSILKHAIVTAGAGLVFVGMLSPAHAAYQQDAAGVFPDLPKTAAADHSSAVLTAQRLCPRMKLTVLPSGESWEPTE